MSPIAPPSRPRPPVGAYAVVVLVAFVTRPMGTATELDAGREWAVYRWAHGCIRLSLDRVTVRLTEQQCRALTDLMRRANQRFSELSRLAAASAQTLLTANSRSV